MTRFSQLSSWWNGSLEGINKSPARFDFAKLENLNGHYIRHSDDADLLNQFMDFLPHVEGGSELLAKIDAPMKAKLLAAMPGLKERAKTLVELKTSSAYLFARRPLIPDQKAAAVLDLDGRTANTASFGVLSSATDWNARSLEQAMKNYVIDTGDKLGNLAQPLRAALTGTTTSPGIFEVLEVLGREEALARIKDQSTETEKE